MRAVDFVLAQRLITAAVGIPLIVVVIIIGGGVYTLVAAAILALAALEFAHAVTGEQAPLWEPRPAGIAAAIGVAAITIGADAGLDEWTGVFVIAMGGAFSVVLLATDRERGLVDWIAVVGALAYIGVLGSYLVLLRELDDDGEWVFLAILATWGTDTSAYAVGKTMGRRKMAPHISPGKTWEGTAGALIGGLVSVVAIDIVLGLPMNTVEAVLLGLLLPPVSVLADLGESAIKRGAGVKDTSELVPGHGGFLDRLDSVLFTVPLVYYWAVWVVFD